MMTHGVAERSAELPTGRISYLRAEGERPTALLLHGNSSCNRAFAHQIAALADAGYGVLAPDLPGHGASANARDPRSTYSFPGYADAIGALLDALRVDHVHVLGWSLGGHVALEMMGGDDRVRSVLVTGAPPVRPSREALEAAFRPTPTMSLAGKSAFTNEDALAYAAAMLGGAEHVTTELLRAAQSTDGEARRWMIENGVGGVGRDEVAVVGTSPVPLAIVQGARDPFLNMDYLRGLSFANIWRGGVQWMDNHGHAPHWETPEAFNRVMLAFLSDVENGAL